VPHRVGALARPLATYLADRALLADRGTARLPGTAGREGHGRGV